MKNSSSPLRWAGGKGWLANDIKTYFERNEKQIFFEPFVGGGSVFLKVNAKRNLICDKNPYLINFWRCLKKGMAKDVCIELPPNDEKSYYEARNKLNEYNASWLTKDDIRNAIKGDLELARLFYYLNKTCFNGLWRTNLQGAMNVPYGNRKNVDFSIDRMLCLPVKSNLVSIKYGSFRQSLKGVLQNSNEIEKYFIYADPPYVDGFSAYAVGGFSMNEQIALTKLLVQLAEKGASVLISNKMTEETKRLYLDNGFKIKVVDAPRCIAANGDRDSVEEILAGLNVKGVRWSKV